MRSKAVLAIIACIGLAQSLSQVRAQKEPVYVGTRICGSCHQGPRMGHQWSRWLASKHALAYAALSMPEAKPIARLSGIEQEPQESVMCLGCHATWLVSFSVVKELLGFEDARMTARHPNSLCRMTVTCCRFLPVFL